MKNRLICLVLLAVLAVLAAASCGAESSAPETPEDGIAEWTVMFYFCGSDLESKYSYATTNLEDISKVSYPYNIMPLYTQDEVSQKELLRDVGKVNILFETGGASRWHSQSLGIDVSPKALQRWQYHYYPDENGDVPEEEFQLMETLPLQNMSDPATLSDFIRWGAQACPAKKYALVLWGHGDSAKSGLMIDELFDKDIMYLYELRQALADGGVYLETLVIDACMMANIETAWNVRQYAHWLVASEETVPGEGTAIKDWLQALVNHPVLDGRWLGRCVCDMTEAKYNNKEDENALQLLTWSVIDLTKVDRLAEGFGQIIRMLDQAIMNTPETAKIYLRYIIEADEFGEDRQGMRDFGDVIYNPDFSFTVDNKLLDEIMDALSDAVVYVARGNGRSEARGISFYYPATPDEKEIEIYAENFPLPSYMAYLDCISSWTAPEWTYESEEKLPELETIDELQLKCRKQMSRSGIPALDFEGTVSNLDELFIRLYRVDERTGDLLFLGKTDCMAEPTEQGGLLWRAENPMQWLAIDDQLCYVELVQNNGKKARLYNIPVQMNTEIKILRCGQNRFNELEKTQAVSEYEIYGVWDGYDENGDLPSRSVKQLAVLAGREYRTVFPLAVTVGTGQVSYAFGETQIMPRALTVTEIPLPAGTYYLEYEIRDVFMRTTRLEKIEVRWDGKEMSFPDGFTWEGAVQMDWLR